MVIAVYEQRELGMPGTEKRRCLARGEPSVERNHCHRHVISVLLRIHGEGRVRHVSVAQTMQIGVVDYEASLQLGRRCLRQYLEEVDERKETEEVARAKAVAQALSLPELGRSAACAIDDRPI